MTRLLPHITTDAEFESADAETDYGPALAVIVTRHGLAPAGPRFTSGSLPVFPLGDAVVKLYPTVDAAAFKTERGVLEAVAGRLPFATPEVRAAGALESWSYLVMSRVPGRSLREGFEGHDLDAALFRELGRGTAALHTLDVKSPTGPDWPSWVEERQRGCATWHAERGASDLWCARIDPYLARWVPTLSLAGTSLLHTEIMREHVFVQPTDAGLALSGLIDFEPSWVGPVGYEFASVGLFTSEGEPGLFGAFLDGYGFEGDRERLAHQTMTWALLHRYARLSWWLSRSTPHGPRAGFDDLAREWFLG
ncbi:MAG: phosphotransferase family protein [Sandaracinaceae bacterium]